MLEVRLDRNNAATRYVAELVFVRWLDLTVVWAHAPSPDVVVSHACAASHAPLTFGGVGIDFSSRAARQLLRLSADASKLNAGDDRLIDHGGSVDWLDQDSLSTIFHLVSGAEETASSVRDSHDRFPSSASSLTRLGLLEVPVADVLAQYLFDRLRRQYPAIAQRAMRRDIVPTHDVDVPFKHAFQSPSALLRSLAGDVMRRGKGLPSVARTVADWSRVRRGDIARDPFNCFDRIMQASETRGLRSVFYFIAGNTAGRIDGDYEIEHPFIRALIRRISQRGHLLGLHPSYHAATQADVLTSEARRLQRVCEQEGCKQAIDLVRTHYLRFDPALTPGMLDRAGFRQDSSLAFADAVGFRRGTCRAFPLWDPSTSTPLRIIEQPLIAMEVSLLADRYKGHCRPEAAATLNKLRSACARFGGQFVLLWHNSSFETQADFELYESAIDAGTAPE